MSSPSPQSGLPDDRLTIVCWHCDKPQDVSRKAMQITCKFCSKPVKVEDLRFSRYEGRTVIETCGIITVERTATVFAQKLHCGSIVVRGKVKGNIISRGTVLVGPEAEIKGNITAPAIAIGAGAVLEGHCEIGKGRGE